jgi:hypothetical protein
VNRASQTVGLAAVIAVIAFVLLFVSANNSANSIKKEWTANEALADSAPQQSVTAEWAIKDAELSQLRQAGVRNGLLAACAVMLIVIAIAVSATDRRPEKALDANSSSEPPPNPIQEPSTPSE